ncbi:MAG: NAD+ synthase [Fibrobacter sp.]|nr:NAD+ synthase [Fibrobacter sp.]
MEIILCQLNPLVGDLKKNASRIYNIIDSYRNQAPDLFVFPELFLQGYPPQDLLERKWFLDNTMQVIGEICNYSRSVPDTGILIGTCFAETAKHGKGLHNSALLVCNGEIIFHQNKSLLPAYDVFDETRYFDASESVNVFPFKDEVLGITICEDAWNVNEINQVSLYERNPVAELANKGATLLINISASPFHIGKDKLRYSLMSYHAIEHKLPVLFLNQTGGNDELIFDGNSMYFDSEGRLRTVLPSFRESIVKLDSRNPGPLINYCGCNRMESVHDALVLGLKDYAQKCGFKKALVGLSGGIDSAVTSALAVQALGPENVWGITMPSRYSSEGSFRDSEKLAKNLGFKISTIPIDDIYSLFLNSLEPHFLNTDPGIAEENLQARIRGTLLMAISNKFGHLLLATGNKSELAVGYSTLYGDMNGGLSVLSDLPKVMVYELADYINSKIEIIPEEIITKAPSAELRSNQKDQDTLPPYPVLDAVLERLIERNWSRQKIIEDGFDGETVDWIISAVARNEYKRRQAPIGLKITPKAFGTGRRFPVASRYEL